MSKNRNILATIFLSIFLVSATRADETKPIDPITPTGIIDARGKEIHDLVISAKSDDEMREKVRSVLEQFVDFPEFGRLCLGSQWSELTPKQQATYLEEFKRLLQNSYLRRFDAGQEFKMTFRKEPRKNKTEDRIQVHTTIIGTGDNAMSADVDYRFYQTKKGWMVYDILVDEVSMMRNYRRSFIKVYKKDGFDELLLRMQKKSKDTDSSSDEI